MKKKTWIIIVISLVLVLGSSGLILTLSQQRQPAGQTAPTTASNIQMAEQHTTGYTETEPLVTEPASSAKEPVTTPPPAETQAQAAEPQQTKPSDTKPEKTSSVPTKAPETAPKASEPPVTAPPTTQPPVKEPPVTEPPATQPPVTEPPVTEPPTTQPPVKEPPVTEPPTTQPPVTEPPVTEPPATQPPVTEPPVTEPPITEPPKPERQEPKASDFTIYDPQGKPVKLSDYFGKPIVLNFWASWCGPCRREMPDFQAKYIELGDKVQFLMVNMTAYETLESATAFIAEQGYTFPVFYDRGADAAYTYNVQSLPTTYFIDAEGYLVAQAVGAINAHTLQNGIDQIT